MVPTMDGGCCRAVAAGAPWHGARGEFRGAALVPGRERQDGGEARHARGARRGAHREGQGDAVACAVRVSPELGNRTPVHGTIHR